MKKIFLILGGLFLVLLVAAGIGAGFFLGNAVKAGVNKLGPQATQSNVVLADAKISPFTGTGTLTGFTVDNPAGWSSGRAFSLGQVHLDVQPVSLFKDTIVVNELVIDQPEFSYEATLFSSNIKTLLANIEKYTGGGGNADSKEGTQKKFIVKKLRFTNGKATVTAAGSSLVVPLPEIKLDNIGATEGGVSGAQVAVVVMRTVLTDVATATATEISRDGGKATLEKAKESAKQLQDTVKNLFKK